MKFGSLFSGIGGFDLAFERAGMMPVWNCEIDKNASSVLAKHWPNVPNLEDVRNVGRNTEPVDVICGGFPCQDLSIAGKRAGLAGERSGLWFEFARVIDELEPQWVIAENVPGLLSSNEGRDFDVILRGLVKLRYGVAWRILDAQYFGVPQRRRRVFIVGHLGDGSASQVLFESEGMFGGTPSRRQAGEEVARTLATGSNKGRYNPLDGETFAISGMAEYKEGIGTLRANGGDLGGGSEMLIAEYPMLQSSQVPAVGVRRLTPTECERLQGYPDGWTEGQSDSARYKQLGNAVAVSVVEWIGRRINA